MAEIRNEKEADGTVRKRDMKIIRRQNFFFEPEVVSLYLTPWWP